MTDWNALPWAIDVSHHNGAIDWPRVAAQNPAAVFLKATERKWTSPAFERNRKACADLGLLWVPYVFLRPDDDEATFRYLIDLIGDRSVPVALDWEEPQGRGTNPVASRTVEAWIEAIEADGGRTPLAYYGLYPPAAPTDRIARCPRWFPQYPGSPTASPRLPMWEGSHDLPDVTDWRTAWLIWQWSDKGSVHGIAGNVDLNRLACSAEVFATWYRTGRFVDDGAAPSRPAQPGPPQALDEVVAIAKEFQARLANINLGKGPLYAGPIDGWVGDRSAKAGTAAYHEWKRLGGA